jgi:hypothetical protein
MGKAQDQKPLGTHQHAQTESAIEGRDRSFSRRALIHAGWTVPVVMAASSPRASIPPSGGHGDEHLDCNPCGPGDIS